MKKSLLLTTALVATAFATGAMANPITLKGNITQSPTSDGVYHIKGDYILDNANIRITSKGDPEGNGTRVSFDGETGNSIQLLGKNTISEQLTVHSKTTLSGDGSLRVNGWLTQTDGSDNGGDKSDLSAVDITIGRNSQNDGALVVATGFNKVGNITFDNTRVSIWHGDNADGISTLNLVDNKAITFNGDTKIGGKGKGLTIASQGSNSKVVNNGTLTLNKDLTVTGGKGLVNKGTINVNYQNLTADVDMSQGGNLNIGVSDTAVGKVGNIIGTSDGKGANVNLVFANNYSKADKGTQLINFGESITSKVKLADNAIYTFSSEDSESYKDGILSGNAKIKVKKNSQSEVASNLTKGGVSANDSGALAAATAGTQTNTQAQSVANTMSQMIQSGNAQGAAQIANQIAPETAPVVQAQVTENVNQVFGAINTRLSGTSLASSAKQGASSGDNVFEKAAMWVQGLFNKSKLDKADGFKNNSKGIAMGAEKELDNGKVGLGYAYTDGEIKADGRKTDVETHTAFAYGEYRPSAWYVNGTMSYSWGDYDESKYASSAKYDVDSIALQAMTGYDFNLNGTIVTPEAGLRYVHAEQDSYTDTLGQHVSSDDVDVLTGILGAKVQRDISMENGMILRPEARLAMTYDMMNDDGSANILMSNGAAYNVEGEALDEFGVEVGAGLTAELNDKVELSVGYEGKFRDDYKDHTGLLNAKYKF